MPEPREGPVPEGVAVLIMLAGPPMPWEKDVPRQLLAVYKSKPETILGRIIRQVQKADHEPIIVTHRQEFRDVTPDLEHFEPVDYRTTIADCILHTRAIWRKQTVILLGDVVYGNDTIKHLLDFRGEMLVVGNGAEVFGLSFNAASHEKLANVLYQVNMETTKGSPWEIYRKWCGFPYKSGQRETTVFHEVWDRCTDIDGPRQYQEMLRVDWG